MTMDGQRREDANQSCWADGGVNGPQRLPVKLIGCGADEVTCT
jgi:hypothetical protein